MELYGHQLACLSLASGPLVTGVFDAGRQSLQVSLLSNSSIGLGQGLQLSLESQNCGLSGLNLSVDHKDTLVSSSEEAILIDDPTTSVVDDFSLHPCDCFPESWSSAPVASQSLKQVPPGSYNIFTPLSVQILQGGAMCPQKFLQAIQYGSSDLSSCEAKCEAEKCSFFWAGSLHGGKQCRLYSNCAVLVQLENAQAVDKHFQLFYHFRPSCPTHRMDLSTFQGLSQ